MKIGDRLRLERLRLGLNQADFAALAGVTKTSQFNYEKGERSPDANYLAALQPHGVDIHFVITGEALPVAESALSKVETELLGYFRGMSETSRDAVRRMAFAMAVADGALDTGAQ
ncbi:helix-turn-helix domain-containing protein [uncultured Pseudomonas sp.]|uniref:helix-turn-helix domain-containing protein n=1 Tax=uncultured Pseudomonas sp. TaxID=114707 RepID=UPI0025FF896F|nr:helix-turn-helix domain-containing protein [uncultured Pseudomonas sp.]